ncbi:MAG: tryptophan synthase subunit beta, partial [Flavobacteriaceae bacterium]|nr:tryptophan synthase subunit beta [Flavobacteriaceae bacterium]
IETSHAFAILDKKEFKKNDILVFNCSGRGDKDLDTYIDYFKL